MQARAKQHLVLGKFYEGEPQSSITVFNPLSQSTALDDPVKLRRIASLKIYIQPRFLLTYSCQRYPCIELYSLSSWPYPQAEFCAPQLLATRLICPSRTFDPALNLPQVWLL